MYACQGAFQVPQQPLVKFALNSSRANAGPIHSYAAAEFPILMECVPISIHEYFTGTYDCI